MKMEVDGLIPLPESSNERAVDVLTRAFSNDALEAYFFPDEAERRRLAPMFHRYRLNQARLYGTVLTTSPDVEGVAVWIHSSSGKGLIATFRGGGLWMVPRIGMKRLKRMLRYKEFAVGQREKYAPEPHMHLTSVAVDPELQGQGFCSKTLRPVFAYLDKIGLPCYLETQSARNVSIYEHYGFEVVSEAEVPDSDLTYWGMVRSPQ